jgi:hypothetical protein
VSTALARWRGLAALIVDAVEQGSRAVERVQTAAAARPFAILEQIPAIAPVARGIHVAHDQGVAGVHLAIRTVARASGAAVDAALDAALRNL